LLFSFGSGHKKRQGSLNDLLESFGFHLPLIPGLQRRNAAVEAELGKAVSDNGIQAVASPSGNITRPDIQL
jgi:hypothetical protein